MYKIKRFCNMTVGGYGRQSWYYKVNNVEFSTDSKEVAQSLCNLLNQKATPTIYKTRSKVVEIENKREVK